MATDRWGNVASYTLTIEATGGSGITVPGYGFLLNNELTDFNFVPLQDGVPDPNLPAAGKRPRSSMSPTIMFKNGRPWLAVGSPGGASIITTVTQVSTEYIDRDLSLVDAIAAPRLSSRNGAEQAEPAIFDGPLGDGLRNLGHNLTANSRTRRGERDPDPAARPIRRRGRDHQTGWRRRSRRQTRSVSSEDRRRSRGCHPHQFLDEQCVHRLQHDGLLHRRSRQ